MKSLVLLLICLSCSLHPKDGDRRLKLTDIPSFLDSYKTYEDVDFFQKVKKKKTFYEVKYLEKGNEVSVKFDEFGNFQEEEKDTEFELLPLPLQLKIQDHLDSFYPKAKIHEVEIRLDEKRQKFIDVEIRHSSSSTKYWELSFDSDGNSVGKKIENLDEIETLN